MAETVDPQVKDALTINNVKTIGESGAFFVAQQYGNKTSSQHRLDLLAEGFIGQMLNTAATVDPTESVSVAKLFKSESDSSIATLLAQLSAGQMGSKIAQSTPGDLSLEITKIGASVASLQSVISSLVAILQQTIKTAQSTPPQSAVPVVKAGSY